MLYFIRHGQTDANLQKLNAGGEADIPLNTTGMDQARSFSAANQDFIKSIDAVFVSPMIRAQQTMQLILGEHKKQIEVVEGLREIMLGEWSGTTYESTSDFFDAQRHPPGGETWPVFHGRVLGALHHAARSHEGKVLVVAHGGVWYSYARQSGHPEPHIENCARQEICRLTLSGLKN